MAVRRETEKRIEVLRDRVEYLAELLATARGQLYEAERHLIRGRGRKPPQPEQAAR